MEEDINPKEFLKARRPERFSDSTFVEERQLDRSHLEYHLSTITNRSQEKDFESFCREIVKREVCPNILPQTGPTGGGDSKVDSETYPVADDLTLTWIVGDPEDASSERWAFAFSAAEQWRSKVRDDIEKIDSTSRNYTKAFFISSQYIRDKDRGEIEDEIRDEHGIDIRIFDRNWLLDRVFDGEHEEIAIETLDIDSSSGRKVQLGPEDLRKQNDLDRLESEIEEKIQRGEFTRQLAEEALKTALLSRRLERPRSEIEGRFERAERVVRKCGSSHQILEVAYERAWTTFWWFEDYDEFNERYSDAEERAVGSKNIHDLELLSNLWTLLTSILRREELSVSTLDWEERTETLRDELEGIREEKHRPSASLWARSLLLNMQFQTSQPEEWESVFEDFEEIILDCEGLIGFPLEPLVQILEELGDFTGDHPAYDELYETIIEVSSRREGEVSAAKMLLRRGEQCLDNDPYEAIRNFGRALSRLYKHESREELVRALFRCASAHDRVGLLWAARGSLVFAASIATDELHRYGDVNMLQYLCLDHLRRIELRLGRIPYALSWHEAAHAVALALMDQGLDEEQFLKDKDIFDQGLGGQLLQIEFLKLLRLEKLPSLLHELELPCAATSLLYALGHEPESEVDPFEELPETNIDEFHISLHSQVSGENSLRLPKLYDERKIRLNSTVLGCNIDLEIENDRAAVCFAESLLASIESFLATGTVDRIVAREPQLKIDISTSDFARDPFSFELEDKKGRPHLSVNLKSTDLQTLTLEEQSDIKEELNMLVARIVGRITIAGDLESVFESLFVDERAIERSVHFTTSFVTTGNVLGEGWKFRIKGLLRDDHERYPLERDDPWDMDVPFDTESDETDVVGEEPDFASPADAPHDLPNPDQIRHDEISIDGLIRVALWEDAGWFGTAFFHDVHSSLPPVLAPLFKHIEPAQKIFSIFQDEIGEKDSNGELRISIVRGIDRSNPHDYRVAIGPGLTRFTTDKRYAISNSRICTMEPESPRNLERFVRAYEEVGKYLLAPATAESKQVRRPDRIAFKLGIMKGELYIREAYEIGPGDPDVPTIQNSDNPVIPDDVDDPPVLELLKWKESNAPG